MLRPDQNQRRNVRLLPDTVLLAMLLGEDIAGGLAGRSLAELFGLSRVSDTRLRESEPFYFASPVLESARELLTRALCEEMRTGINLTSPDAVRDFLKMTLGNLPQEVFAVLFLDSQNRLLEVREMFTGTLTQTSVYPREVVKAALEINACSVILAHNHPSGVDEPSQCDEMLTRTLKQALSLVDVRVLDHFVVAGLNKPLSFVERGLL